MAAITNIIDATRAAGEYFDRIDATGSWQAAATLAVTFEYPTAFGLCEATIDRDAVAKARAHGLI